MDDSRIIELEIKVAYQDDLLQILNQTVAGQQQTIERLQVTCQWLHERIRQLSETGSEKPGSPLRHDIPPHY